MTLALYAHPFSSYCQKVLIALYENDTPFDFRMLELGDAAALAELERLWPLQKFPVLTDGEQTFAEASIIVEYLQIARPGPVELIPREPLLALEVRLLDRVFDNYISNQQQRFVINALRSPADRDQASETDASRILETTYRWLDQRLADREWAAGDRFTLADCAAAPALFYAHWTFPIDGSLRTLLDYRTRLLQRASFARAVDEARPYRPLFPLLVPDED